MTNPESSATPNPNEGGNQATQVNPENYVPKDQYTADLNAKAVELQSLQRSLEEAQTNLTSPEYLKYLANKKASANAQREPAAPASDKELRDRLANLEVIASQLAASLELSDVERKYGDFSEYRSDVQKIIQSNGNLSFEQAYLVAKGKKPLPATPVTPVKPQGDKQAVGTEKPGKFVPDSSTSEKEFKSGAEASADAVRQIREKYGISDTL